MINKYLIIIIFLSSQLINAQLRKKYDEIHKLFPDSQSSGLRIEGSSLVEDLKINNEKKMFIIYNKDSIAIGIGNSDKNPIDEGTYKQKVKEEIPSFKITKIAKVNSATYYYDEFNKYLILTKSMMENEVFPLKSFIIIIEPNIIDSWTKNITNWE